MNLTGITEPDEIVIKHFVDSLKFFEYVDVLQGASIIDVGTGAGFPGLPLLLARNDIALTLMDSLNKRLVFLGEVLKNVICRRNLFTQEPRTQVKKPVFAKHMILRQRERLRR